MGNGRVAAGREVFSIPEILGSNPAIGKFYTYTINCSNNCIEKTKTKKKEAWRSPPPKKVHQSFVHSMSLVKGKIFDLEYNNAAAKILNRDGMPDREISLVKMSPPKCHCLCRDVTCGNVTVTVFGVVRCA